MDEIVFEIALSEQAARGAWLDVLAARCSGAIRSLGRGAPRAVALAADRTGHSRAAGQPCAAATHTITLSWLGNPAQAEPVCVLLASSLRGAAPGFTLHSTPIIRTRPPALALAVPTEAADVCIELLTPMLLPCEGHSFGSEQLMALVAQRYSQLFGKAPPCTAQTGSLQLLAHFAEVKPSARGLQVLGSLFLRGATPALLEALGALQPFHLQPLAPNHAVGWRGRFRMRWQLGPWLDQGLARPVRLARVAQQAFGRNDMEPITGERGALLEPLSLARQLAAQLKSPLGYCPKPTTAWHLHRPGKAPRMLEKLNTADLIVQQHMLRMLAPCFERLFTPTSFGFRAGLGREDAVNAVRAALRDGYVHVVECDIAQCFASIDHARLGELLDRCLLRVDVRVRALLAAFVTQPYTLDGKLHPRTAGLAQGAPLSPLLANLYLTALDHAVDTHRFRLVRFADDFVVLARSRSDAAQALQDIGVAVGNLGLQLAPEKTCVTHVQQGFTFLGERFVAHEVEPLAVAVAAQRKPLLVTEPYLQIGVNGGAIEARRAGRLVGAWPMRRLSGLLLMAQATLSTTLLQRCSQNGIGIAVATRGGKDVVVVAPNQRAQHDMLHAHAQWHEGLSTGARLAAAQAVVAAKLHNCASLVQQRDPRSELLHTLAESERSLRGATTIEALRGHEGHAARVVFKWLQGQFVPRSRDAFASRRRARGGADRLNSLLNLGYHLLFARLNAMVRLRPLNPYLGWLHDAVDDYETLVYDLMEPFRPFVDRLVLRMVNRQEIGVSHFEKGPDGDWLTRVGVQRVAECFERMLGERVSGHLLRDLLWTQVRSVQDLALGRGPLWLFRWDLRDSGVNIPTQEPPMWSAGSDTFDAEETGTAAQAALLAETGEPA